MFGDRILRIKNLRIGAIAGLAFLSGCASSPEDLQKAYVSPTQFMALNCTQLGGELERVSARKVELYNQLKKTADNDAAQMTVGLLILWPTLFFLEGGDGPQAAEYSRLLGEEETIQKMMVQKNCGEELIKAKQFVPGTAGVDIRLQKLQELLDAGTISQDEFDDQRSRILKEI